MPNIVFKSIRFKNVFSVGNTFIDIDLTKSPSTLILGKNGVGKSSIYESLHYGLFGTTIRSVKKSQVVNEKNKKDAVVEIALEKGGVPYQIKRTINPDSLTVKQGEQTLDFPNVRACQKYINDNILGGDKTAFQITTLISKSGIPMFMGLKAEDRRRFIDRMLETVVFTEMRKLQKFDMDAANEKKQQLELENVKLTERMAFKKAEIDSIRAFNEELVGRYLLEKKNALEASKGVLEALLNRKANYQPFDHMLNDFKPQEVTLKKRVNELINQREKVEKDHDDVINSLNGMIDKLKKSIQEGYESLKHTSEKALKETIKACNVELTDSKAKLKSVLTMVDNLKVGKCPVCLTEVDEEHIAHEKDVLLKEAKLLKEVVVKTTDKLADAEQKLSDYNAELAVVQDKELSLEQLEKSRKDSVAKTKAEVSMLSTQIEQTRGDLENLRLTIDSASKRWHTDYNALNEEIAKAEGAIKEKEGDLNTPPSPPKDDKLPKAKAELKELIAAADVSKKQLKEANEEIEYQKMIAAMLKDGGIKTVVVKRFLPIINNTVNEELQALGFHARFFLDENFNESITYNGNDRVFDQFSEGEKLRINVALILAWRKIARLQGRMDSNLLLWDETLGESLDSDGYEALAEIFKRFEDMNVFIITHNAVKLENFVHSKMHIVKVGGFTRLD